MKKKAFIYIIIAGILWGTSGLFFNVLDGFGFSAIQMSAMRGCVSGIAMLIYGFFKPEIFKVSLKHFIIFALSGVFVFITASSYFAAIGFSSVSTAVILMYTAPIFVMIYSVSFLGEKLSILKTVSVILMIAGCALVSGVIGGMKFSFLGISIGLLSGIAYSAYNITAKIGTLDTPNSFSATLYCFLVMGFVALLFANPPQMVALTLKNPEKIVPLIIGIGIVTCVLPYFLYASALRYIPAGTASALGIIEPMAATLFSVMFLNEHLTIFSIVGIVSILIAVTLLNINKE